jgi:hypothetical protein
VVAFDRCQRPRDAFDDVFGREFIGRDKVLGARLEGSSGGLHRSVGGKNDDWDIGSRSDSAEEVKAIGCGHHEIGDHYIGCPLAEPRPALDAVARLLDLKAAVTQIIREGGARQGLIIDHENVAAHKRLLAPGCLYFASTPQV